MTARNRLLAILGWMQMLFSLSLAAAIIWGYMACQASVGQFFQSIAATVESVSNVVVRTAETIEARRELFDQAGQMLTATRSLINELRVVVENQATVVPRYAEGLRSASSVTGSLSGTLQSMGDALLLEMPTGIRWEGLKPVVIMSRPMEKAAQSLKANSQDLKVVSTTLANTSDSIGRDGKKVMAAFAATNEQALKVVTEVEATLGRLKTQDLPMVIVDLRTISENLQKLRAQVDIVGNLGLVFLIVGLLLSGWAFSNGLGMLMLASADRFDSTTTTSSSAASWPIGRKK